MHYPRKIGKDKTSRDLYTGPVPPLTRSGRRRLGFTSSPAQLRIGELNNCDHVPLNSSELSDSSTFAQLKELLL